MSLALGDKKAAFVGMIVTTALLFVMAFTIVKLTNSHFEKEKAAEKKEEPAGLVRLRRQDRRSLTPPDPVSMLISPFPSPIVPLR